MSSTASQQHWLSSKFGLHHLLKHLYASCFTWSCPSHHVVLLDKSFTVLPNTTSCNQNIVIFLTSVHSELYDPTDVFFGHQGLLKKGFMCVYSAQLSDHHAIVTLTSISLLYNSVAVLPPMKSWLCCSLLLMTEL